MSYVYLPIFEALFEAADVIVSELTRCRLFSFMYLRSDHTSCILIGLLYIAQNIRCARKNDITIRITYYLLKCGRR